MIGWRDGAGGLHQGSVFAAFAALARGEAWSFPALRPHQREPWHAFTVQVAALALIRAGIATPPEDEDAWRSLLVALSDGVPEAWEMVVDDWSKPALLQPPVPFSANPSDFDLVPTPDSLDILINGRNHDLKNQRIANSTAEDWLYSLIALQTYEGYSGRCPPTRFFHGVSRMNGGASTRMTLSARPAGGAGVAFRRDVMILLEDARQRDDRRSGLALLWLDPWDGTRSLEFPSLDELYVEVCRRVRLRCPEKTIEALHAATAVPRIAAKGLHGKTDDPWAPLKADGSASVGASRSVFGYRGMARLLDEKETSLPLLSRLHPDDNRQGLSIVATALVRGQSKTEGFHRRTVRTSRVEEIEENRPALVLDRVGDVAMTRAKDAGEAADKLRYALYALLQGAPSEPGTGRRLAIRLKDKASIARAREWTSLFDQHVQSVFFDNEFWSEAAEDEENHRERWRKRLRKIARDVFVHAAEAAPRTEMQRIRAIARAKSLLEGAMSKWIKEVA